MHAVNRLYLIWFQDMRVTSLLLLYLVYLILMNCFYDSLNEKDMFIGENLKVRPVRNEVFLHLVLKAGRRFSLKPLLF